MRKLKQVAALSMAAILTAGLLAGCGAPKAVGTTSKVETGDFEPYDGDVTLQTVSMFGGTDPNATVYQAINEQFMKDHGNVTISDDSTTSSQEWKTKIASDFSVGNEPDVIQYFADYNAKAVLAANQFVPISEIQAKYPDYAKDTKPEVLKAVSAPDGVTYAVPTTGFYEGIFCNKELFDKYNLELPTTWENLTKAIETFSQNDIIPIAVSLNEVPHYWVENLLLSSAGAKEYTTVPTEAPESWVKGLEVIKTLRDMGAFPKDTDTIDNAFANTLFAKESAAMQLDGSWYGNGLKDGMENKTVVVAFPTIEGGKKTADDIVSGFSSGFYITKKAWNDPKKRDAAVQFVMAHTNKESVMKYWAGAGVPSVEAEMPSNVTPVVESGYNMSLTAKNLCAATDARIEPEAFSTLISRMSDISKGNVDAKDAINEALKINNKQIEKDKKDK